MMPPTALKAMSFSDKGVNEAVTVGIRLDPKTGGVASSRVMLTTLPPAVPLTFDQTDRCLLHLCMCVCFWLLFVVVVVVVVDVVVLVIDVVVVAILMGWVFCVL